MLHSLPKDQDCHELWWKKYKKMQRQELQLKEQQEAGKGGVHGAAGVRVPLRVPDKAGPAATGDKAKPVPADTKPVIKQPLAGPPTPSGVGSVPPAKPVAVPDKPVAVPPVKPAPKPLATSEPVKPKVEGDGVKTEPPPEEVATVQAQLTRLITIMQAKRSLSVEQIAQSLNINVDNKMVALLDQFRRQMPQPSGGDEAAGQPEVADLAFVALGSGLAAAEGPGQTVDKHAGVKAALAHLLTQSGGGAGVVCSSPPAPPHYMDARTSSAPSVPALLREPPPTSLGVPSAAAQRPRRVSDCADDAGPPSFSAGSRAFVASDDSRSSLSSVEDPSRGGPRFYDRDRDVPGRRIGISPGEFSERPHLGPDWQGLIPERPPLMRDYPDRGTGGPARGAGMGAVQGLGQDSFRRGGGVGDGYRGGVGMGGDGFDSFRGNADSFHGMSGSGPDRRDGGPMYRGRGGEGRGGFQGGRGGSYAW